MIEYNDYIFFEKGFCEIGIDPSDVDNIVLSLKSSGIKRDYISASTPKKKINFEQFYIRKKLITAEEFSRFVSVTSYVTESEKEGWGWVWNGKWIKKENVSWKSPFLNETDIFYNCNRDILPVMQISWNDAVEYTKWLSRILKKNIRLPYEFEWEILGDYAGIGSITDNFSDKRWIYSTDQEYAATLKDNILSTGFQLGLVWEWTSDWYKGYDDVNINKDFGNIYKTLRGGSILSENIQRSKEFRFRRCPTARSPYYSFRVVMTE